MSHLYWHRGPHATVLLSGEGSDEVFGGYGLYQRMLIMEKGYPFLKFLKYFTRHPRSGDRIKKYMDWVSSPLAHRYRGTSADVTERIRSSFYSEEYLRYVKENRYTDEVFLEYFDDAAHCEKLSQLLYVDSKTWLPDDLLLKADKMTMAASIELRVPFLDHEIVEFVSSLPAKYKIRNGEGKFILKKLLEGLLPQ